MKRPLVLVLLGIVGCARSQGPPQSLDPPDANPTSPCEQACANLARLGCPEATSSCVSTCDDDLAAGLGAIDPVCVAGAADRGAVEQCNPELCL
jgi:hypothetical protein